MGQYHYNRERVTTQGQMGYYPNNTRYPNSNWKNNQQRQQAPAKKSGAVFSPIKQGKFVGALAINAWKSGKNGLITLKAFPYTDEVAKSKKGNVFMKYIAEVHHKGTGMTQKYTALLNMSTKKLIIKEIDAVVSQNGSGYTASGKRVSGYFGRNYRGR